MIKCLKYLIPGVLLISNTCSKKEIAPPSFEVNIKDTLSIAASAWFSSMEIIPLETVEASLIHGCDKIEYDGQQYYIFDSQQFAVFVFDNSGKFLFSTLSSKGNGPGEYLTMTDIAINRTTGNLETLDVGSRKIFIFDKNGSYIKDLTLPRDLLPLGTFRSLSDKFYLFYSADRHEDGECIHVYAAEEQRVVNRMFWMKSSSEDHLVKTRIEPFYWIDSVMMFSQMFPNNDVYQIHADLKMKKRYSYDFGSKTFDASSLPKDEDPSYYRSFVPNNMGKYAFPFLKFENSNYLFCFFVLDNYYDFYVSRHKKSQRGEQMTAEVITAKFKDGGKIHPPMLFDNDYMYCVIEPSQIPDLMNDLLTDEQKDMLNKISENDNPLIVKYRYQYRRSHQK